MNRTTLTAIATLGAWLGAAGWASPPPPATGPAGAIKMAKPEDYPHAGVSLAVPSSFKHVAASEPSDVMRAVLTVNSKPAQAVSMSAFLIKPKATAATFADAMNAELKKNLTLRHFKVVTVVENFRVAGTTGLASVVSYVHRGVETFAARVYFIRELKPTQLRLCYVLTVESSSRREALPVLGEVLKTLRLTAVRHPVDAPPGREGPVVARRGCGFTVRPPRGWYVLERPSGLAMAQSDYLRGGQPTVTVQITVGELPAGATCGMQADKYLQVARKSFPDSQVVRGPADLAGLKGHQFILRQTLGKARTQPTTAPEQLMTIIQRVASVPGSKDRASGTISVVLVGQGGKVERLSAIMDKIVSSVKLTGRLATTVPAGGAATAPAR